MDSWLIGGASALFAALAALAWSSPVRDRRFALDLADERPAPLDPPPWGRARRRPGWRGIAAGRLDAPPLRRRLAISAVAATASAVAIMSFDAPLPAWMVALAVPVASLAGAVGLGLLEPAATRRRSRRLIEDAPQALDLLAACLAAGLPARNATAAVVAVFDGPIAEDLGLVARAVEVGLSDVVAWRSLREHPQLGEAALDLARAVESGTRMVETLTYYAREARLRRAAAVESAAKAVGVRCVLPMMICFIPSFLLLGVVPATVSAFLAAVPHIF